MFAICLLLFICNEKYFNMFQFQSFKVSKFQRCLFGAGVCTLPAGVRICPGRGREEEEEVEKQEEEEDEEE